MAMLCIFSRFNTEKNSLSFDWFLNNSLGTSVNAVMINISLPNQVGQPQWFPAYSSCSANLTAAAAATPQDIPTNKPSSLLI